MTTITTRLGKALFAAFGWAWLGASAQSATPPLTAFEITLTIDRLAGRFAPCVTGLYGCLHVGDTFRGRFSVETSILAHDGRNDTASIYDFYLPFGSAVFSTGSGNTALAGFSTFGGSGPAAIGPSAAPSFRIASGQVVDWSGSVNGIGPSAGCCGFTFPFIHFQGMPPHVPDNRFDASDRHSLVQGTVSIAPAVPEPQTYAMWLLGMGLVLCAVKRHTAVKA
jgi:hypothetical protein